MEGREAKEEKVKAMVPKARAKMPLCVNCGSKDHTLAQCKQPIVDVKERPCYMCGTPGHMAHQCPEKAKAAKSVESEQSVEVMTLGIEQGKYVFIYPSCIRPVQDCDAYIEEGEEHLSEARGYTIVKAGKHAFSAKAPPSPQIASTIPVRNMFYLLEYDEVSGLDIVTEDMKPKNDGCRGQCLGSRPSVGSGGRATSGATEGWYEAKLRQPAEDSRLPTGSGGCATSGAVSGWSESTAGPPPSFYERQKKAKVGMRRLVESLCACGGVHGSSDELVPTHFHESAAAAERGGEPSKRDSPNVGPIEKANACVKDDTTVTEPEEFSGRKELDEIEHSLEDLVNKMLGMLTSFHNGARTGHSTRVSNPGNNGSRNTP